MIALALTAALATRAAVDEHPGAQLPLATAFTDTRGAPTTLGDALGGHASLLVLAYARCTMLCSTVLHGIADATADLDAPLTVISIDPRETPDEGARRAANLGRPATYLVGTQASIDAVADALGFRYAWDDHSEQFVHPAVIFAITPDGRVSHYLYGVTWSKDELAGALADAAAGRAVATTANADVLACFRYDAAARHQLAKLQLFLRIGGGAIFLALIGLVGGLWRWERRR